MAPLSTFRLRDQSLARKIVAVTMGVTSTALLIAGAALMAYDSASARKSLSRDIGILADVVGANSTAAVAFGDASGGRETLEAVAANKSVLRAAIVKDGQVFARFDREPATASARIDEGPPADLLHRPVSMSEFDDFSLRVMRPIVLDGELLGAVYIESDLFELGARRQQLIGTMGLVLLGSIAVAFALSFRLQRVVSGPVLRLTEATRRISRDKNYELRVEATGRDEVGILIDGFNEMLAEIQGRDRQLTEHHEALERTVAMRTADLRAANEELLAARDKAMAGSRAKSEFLANISHEIRTPMNGIVGMTELALDSTLTDEQRDCLETVKSSAASLLGLLNDILDFSKIESKKLELETISFDVTHVIDNTLKRFALMADRKGIELVADLAPTLPAQFKGDPGRLSQVLANLVGNAVKFTENGHVCVRVDATAPGGGETQLHVAVSDTGIGIPRDKHETIFESFSQADGSTTRRFGGTGLGLAISSSLAGLMGGRLWVESEQGRGSTFHLTVALPVVDRGRPSRDPALNDVPVLVVDDNDLSRRVLSDLLRACGMRPSVAGDARTAAAMLAPRAGVAPFRLLLVDANMPDIDGFTLIERMASAGANRPPVVMMLATSGRFGDARRCRELGIQAHVPKPVCREDLLDAIRRSLQLPAPAGAAREHHTPAPDPSPLRILLAEDNVVNQKVAVGLLTRRGHSVTVVDNGLEAIAAWEARSFDVILMDIQMPDMGGVEATRIIREREAAAGRHTWIVAMTAHAMVGDRERYLAEGIDDYVSKPIDHRVLMAALENAQQLSAAPNEAPYPKASGQ